MRRHRVRIEMINGTRALAIAAMAGALALVAAGCGDSDDDDGDGDWTCDAAHEDWERCTDGKVQWCHVLQGMDPHFHWGTDCAAQGYECVEPEPGQAVCLDAGSDCTVGESKCEENTAYNCLDHGGHGHWAVEPCGTAKDCHAEADGAHCEAKSEECGGHGHLHDGACHCDDGYEQDPADPTSCIATLSFPELACQTFNDGKDSIPGDHHLDATDSRPGPHAHLDEVMGVHLLAANASNYVHFPVLATGEYVLFLDTAGVVTRFYDKDGNEVPFTNPGPNGFCEDDLVDHFHIAATYTGDGTSPVPTIVEVQVDADTEVKLLVMFHDE